MKTIRKTTWNTYAARGYTHDVANDQRSAGGVHLHQVRKGSGGWEKRIEQSNGRWSAFGETSPISDEDGEAYFEMARKY